MRSHSNPNILMIDVAYFVLKEPICLNIIKDYLCLFKLTSIRKYLYIYSLVFAKFPPKYVCKWLCVYPQSVWSF